MGRNERASSFHQTPDNLDHIRTQNPFQNVKDFLYFINLTKGIFHVKFWIFLSSWICSFWCLKQPFYISKVSIHMCASWFGVRVFDVVHKIYVLLFIHCPFLNDNAIGVLFSFKELRKCSGKCFAKLLHSIINKQYLESRFSTT